MRSTRCPSTSCTIEEARVGGRGRRCRAVHGHPAGQRPDPGHHRGGRQRHEPEDPGLAGPGLRRRSRPGVGAAGRAHVGQRDHEEGDHRAAGLPRPAVGVPGALLRLADGGRRPRRPHPRHRHHGRRLLAPAVRGHAEHDDRHPDDPRVLALRHRRRLRQGQGEHPRASSARAARPTRRRPTWPSTRPSCAASTPRSWPCCRSRRSSSWALACSGQARSRTCRWHCSSAWRPAPTPRSSSPRPFLAQLMERNPQMKALAGRVKARGRGSARCGGRGDGRCRAASRPSTPAEGADPQAADAAAESTEAMDRARARRTPAVRATSRRSRAGPTGTDQRLHQPEAGRTLAA